MHEHPSHRECPYCDEGTAYATTQEQQFHYGSGDQSVLLSTRVPVYTCDTCGLSFTDWRAEELREKAVQDHLSNRKSFAVPELSEMEIEEIVRNGMDSRHDKLNTQIDE